MSPERLKEIRRSYERARTEIEGIVGQALCETYRKVTGKEPSDRLREAFEDAIRFNT
jgi:hypothetical protein